MKKYLWKNKFVILLGLDILLIIINIICLILISQDTLWLYGIGVLALICLVLAPLAGIEKMIAIHKNSRR